jgi:hypothetical protein
MIMTLGPKIEALGEVNVRPSRVAQRLSSGRFSRSTT